MSSTVRKVTIALGAEEYAWAREQAERSQTSVSAVLTEAARCARDRAAREAARAAAWAELEAWITGGEPLDAQELAAAERELDRA
ncbi:MAG: hypothetical protein KF729_32245 [Sandaracinaceae bacterium]|nr:hypothetical protein [Sandaracinaceae bacterium]